MDPYSACGDGEKKTSGQALLLLAYVLNADYNFAKSILGYIWKRRQECVNRVDVHRVKNPSRMRSVQAVVNQQSNVYVTRNRSNFL